MNKRQIMVSALALLVLGFAIIMFLAIQANSSLQPNFTATAIKQQSIDATNHAVMTALGPPFTKAVPTSTLAPEVLATANARNATNSANATRSWLNVAQTAT